MGMFSKILRVGEGRKVKALESLVPEVNDFEDEFRRLSDDARLEQERQLFCILNMSMQIDEANAAAAKYGTTLFDVNPRGAKIWLGQMIARTRW